MADAVGGVPVCVSKAIDDPYSGLKLPAGRSVITGRTALAYLRSRHGVGDGSDLARISSQQAYMSSLMRKMTSSSTLTSPTRLYTLASTAAQTVTLSTSLASIDTMASMLLAREGHPDEQVRVRAVPDAADPLNRNKVVPSAALAATLMDRVQQDESIGLGKNALGLSTKLAAAKKKAAAAAAAKKGAHPDAHRDREGVVERDRRAPRADGGREDLLGRLRQLI